MMTSEDLTRYIYNQRLVLSCVPGEKRQVSFLPLHSHLHVILQSNFSIIIAHCFVVIYSSGTYGTESRQMMKLTASVKAKLFGGSNYNQETPVSIKCHTRQKKHV